MDLTINIRLIFYMEGYSMDEKTMKLFKTLIISKLHKLDKSLRRRNPAAIKMFKEYVNEFEKTSKGSYQRVDVLGDEEREHINEIIDQYLIYFKILKQKKVPFDSKMERVYSYMVKLRIKRD